LGGLLTGWWHGGCSRLGKESSKESRTMRTIEIREHERNRAASVLALTLLRVAVGGIFVVHGAMKLDDVAGTAAGFAKAGIPAPEVMVYFAILGELFGGLGLLLGALTPLAAMGPVLVMAGAIWFVHRGHGMLNQNHGWEWPLTLLLVALFFAAHGPGPISVDELAARFRRRPRHLVPASRH
jgi:putative oxidoreductase